LRINRLRTSPRYHDFFQRLKWRWLPPAFGAPLLILLIAAGLTGVGVAAVRGGIWAAEADYRGFPWTIVADVPT
jgi:hypothetical protein